MPNSSTVLIASDHAGLFFKSKIQKLLNQWQWSDLGPHTSDGVDYPDYAELLSRKIVLGEASHGLLICGTGIGMCIAANKISGIRAALAENPLSAQWSREHNDANILCLGSRVIAPEYGAEITRTWLNTSFSQQARHLGRIRKIQLLEKGTRL